MSDLRFSVQLTADGQQLRGDFKLSRDEVNQFVEANKKVAEQARRTTSETEKQTRAQKDAAEATRREKEELERLDRTAKDFIRGQQDEIRILKLLSQGRREEAAAMEIELRMQRQLGPAYAANANQLRAVTDEVRKAKREVMDYEAAQSKLRREQTESAASATRLFGAMTALVTVYGAGRVTMQVDQYQSLKDRLKAVNENTLEYIDSLKELRDISADTGTTLEANVSLFQRMGMVQKDLEATTNEMLLFNRAVQQLGVISGSSGEQLRAGTLQLGQALSANVMRAEEFNSVMENIPLVGVKIAAALGMTPGQLRLAVIEGRVLSQDVFQAILTKAPEIGEEFEKMPVRLGRALGAMKGNLLDTLGRMDEAAGVTSKMAQAVGWLSEHSEILIGGGALVGITTLIVGLTAAVKLARTAMLGLNLAMLANPFVLAAAGIAAVGVGLWAWKHSADAAAASTNNLSGSMQKALAMSKAFDEANAQRQRQQGRDAAASNRAGGDLIIDLVLDRSRATSREVTARQRGIEARVDRDQEYVNGRNAAIDYIRTREEELEVVQLLQAGYTQEAELLKQRLALQKQLGPAYAQFADRLEDVNKEVQRENALLEIFNRTRDEAGQAALASMDEMTARGTAASQMWSTVWNRATENMVDALADGFRRGRIALSDFLDVVKDLGSQIASALIFQPMVGNIMGGLAGLGMPGASGAASAGGMGQYLPGAAGGWLAGKAAGFGEMLGFSPGSFVTPDGVTVGIQGSMTNATLGGTLGAAGLGYMAGSMLQKPLGLKSGAKWGAAAGAGAGIMLGGPLGALIGGGLGTLVGGMFGAGESNKTEGNRYDFATGRTEVSFLSGKRSEENRSITDGLTSALADFASGLKALGLKSNAGAFSVAAGSRDGIEMHFDSQSANISDPKAAGRWLVQQFLGTLVDVPEKFQGLIDSIDYNNLDGFMQKLGEIVAWDQELAAIKAENAFARDPQAAEFAELDKAYTRRKDLAVKFGEGMADVEEWYGNERKKIVAKYGKEANDTVAEAAKKAAEEAKEAAAQRFGDLFSELAQAQADSVAAQIEGFQDIVQQARRLSQGLNNAAFDLRYDPRRSSPSSQISALTPLFDELMGKAMGGDLAAGEQLKTVGDHLLEAAEKAYGTTGAWQAIADKIERGYSSVATKAESQASIASQQLSVLQEQLAELRRIASGGAPAQPISQSGTTAQDWNSLNASYASAYDAAKSSGMSDSQWVSSSQFGVFQQALLNRIGNSSDIGKLESDLGAYSDAPADSPFAANASLVTGAIRSRLRALNVPGYKYGGAHAGGLRMVGEEGAELEVTGPARYYSHQQTRAMLGSAMQDNAGLGGKLDQLIGQNTQLLSYVSRLVSINQGQSELLKEQAQIIKRQDQLLRDRDLQRRAA